MRNLFFLLLVVSANAPAANAEHITITTWNIEHLGSPGRGFGGGFGGFGAGAIPDRFDELPLRNDAQLVQLAGFIQDTLKSDVLALQEIAITGKSRGRSKSKPLDTMVAALEAGGGDWAYFLQPVEVAPEPEDERNQFLAFLWNRDKVRMRTVFEADFRNHELAGKALFDRPPLIGYFQTLPADGKPGNDFVLVNVHLASGQHYDENHLIAMTVIEFALSDQLARRAVTESDRVILGDFNDNRDVKKPDGSPRYSPALYEHMKYKGFIDLVTADMKTSRMNSRLDSLIDHVLVNRSARRHLIEERATMFRPDAEANDPAQVLPAWRATFSDHFPISFRYEVKSGHDDSDFFQ